MKTPIRYTPQPAILEAMHRLAVRHTYLSRMLRLTIRSLTGEKPTESMMQTDRTPAPILRERVAEAMAKAGIADDAIAVLDSLLVRAERASERRNRFVRSVYSCTYGGEDHEDANAGDDVLLTKDAQAVRLPLRVEVRALYAEIGTISDDLDDARKAGPIAVAMQKAKARKA